MVDSRVKLEAEVGIIGAGVAGLSAARRLTDEGVTVKVLDKGRRPGGRLATNRNHDRQFDHGAQYLRPHSGRAAVLFSNWRKAGVIKPWRAVAYELPQRKKIDTTSWHVAVPSQNSLAKWLAKDLSIQCQFTALDISGEPGNWSVIGHKNQSSGPFGTVFVTSPPEQTAVLFKPFQDLYSIVSNGASRPCLATMVEFEEEVMVDFEAAFLESGPLAFVCRDSAKPERPNGECWVLHASESWSREKLELTPEKVASLMLSAFASLSLVELPPVSFCRSHRWRLALPSTLLDIPCYLDKEMKLGFAGDWCKSSSVDGAYFSGLDLAESYLSGRI